MVKDGSVVASLGQEMCKSQSYFGEGDLLLEQLHGWERC